MAIDMSHQPPPERREAVARAGLASLKRIATSHGPMTDRARSMLEAARDHLLRVDIDIDALETISPEELAREVPEPEWRERILRGMTITALVDGDTNEVRLAMLRETASALEIDDAPIDTFHDVLDEKFRMVQIDIARRGFLRQAAQTYVKVEGMSGILDVAKGVLGREDPALAAKYHELDTYPEGTFGRAFADFIGLNHFTYPGEVGGPPAPVMRHDCCHVLGGYGTTPSEECAVVAFQAGFEKADPFFVLLFALAQFELGIGSSPFLPGMKRQVDPDTMLAGLAHGSQVNRDLIGDPTWDPWEHFSSPIDELREVLNIQPRGREPDYAPLEPTSD